jgi:hypothetical protein
MDHHHLRSPGGNGMGGHASFGGAFSRRGFWGDRDFGMGMGIGSMLGTSMREAGRKEELVDVTYTEKLKKCEPFGALQFRVRLIESQSLAIHSMRL